MDKKSQNDAKKESLKRAVPTDDFNLETQIHRSTGNVAEGEAPTLYDKGTVADHLESQSIASSQEIPSLDFGSLDFSLNDIPEVAKLLSQQAAIGSTVGEYEILEELGRGGMGVVYKARHKKLDRIVALKMILVGVHASQDELERFVMEARAVAHLQHPNIVQIFDIGDHNGLPYFSLECVDGASLEDLIRDKSLSPDEAARIVRKIALALNYAHDEGIVHRDIKPANILLTKEGEPKITDFGLAKLDEANGSRTRTGQVMGTPSYMPPEQAQGRVKEIGPATDQYSLGAVLYRMLTGRPPFSSPDPVKTIMQVIGDDAMPLRQIQPDVPKDLETICLKAMQKLPVSRYSSCTEFADDLGRFLNSEPITARPIGTIERAWKWCRRNPRIAIPTAVAAVLLIGLTSLSTWAYSVVSAQNEQILKEKEFAVKQEAIAKKQTRIANEQTRIANDKTKVAVEQAKIGLTVIQDTLGLFQKKIMEEPKLEVLGLPLAETLNKSLNRLDASIWDDEGGTAIPTLMSLRNQMSTTFANEGRYDDAIKSKRELLKLCERRMKIKNRNDATRLNTILVLSQLANLIQDKIGGYEESISLLERASKIGDDILEHPKPEIGNPNSPKEHYARFVVAQVKHSLGAQYFGAGRHHKFKSTFKELESLRVESLKRLETDEEFLKLPEATQAAYKGGTRSQLQTVRSGLATQQIKQGDVEVGVKNFRKLVDEFRNELGDDPSFGQRVAFQNMCLGFGRQLMTAALLSGEDSYFRNSEESFLEAKKLVGVLLEEKPGDVNIMYRNVRNFSSLSQVYRFLDQEDKSTEYGALAEQFARELNEKSPGKRHRQIWIRTLALAGNWEKSKALVDEYIQSAESFDQFKFAAMAYSFCAEADGAPVDELKEAAIAAIQKSVAAGYNDWTNLHSDPDLNLILKDPRMIELVKQLKEAK